MYGWNRYVPVAQRRAKAAKEAAKVTKAGGKLSPVVITGRTITTSFWGQAWCTTMESYGDYANRLPRGRTYARNGSIVDLQIHAGVVHATVSGSSLYRTSVRVAPIQAPRWRQLVDRHGGHVSSLVDLLQGKLPASLLRDLTDRSSGLLPTAKELTFSCSCPDWAEMCKHVAAVLYGVGARLDSEPALFFTLRGVEVADLVARSATVSFASGSGPDELEGTDLGELFGIDLGAPPPIPVAPPATPPVKAAPPAVPPPSAHVPVPFSSADLRFLGFDTKTINGWLAKGILVRSGTRGVYLSTPQTGEALRNERAKQKR